MKKLSVLFFALLAAVALHAQTTQFIHTNGRYIFGPCGDTLLLRGIDYAPYDWGYDITSLELNQVVQAGANVVRMPWYYDNSNATANAVYQDFAALDSAVSKCVENKMIAIIEIHDYTCSDDTTALFNLNTWWTQDSVFNVILQKHKESVIVNYANEAGVYAWDSVPAATALTVYQRTYENIITALRSKSGFNFPIMIDAPDCGTSSDAFVTSNMANNLIQFDPQHNLIFSTHAYWYAYANNDSTTMASDVDAVISQNIPLVLGEVADLQDGSTNCEYTLNYQPLLKYCQLKKVGWIAWSWDNDDCSNRQISSTGNFSDLTTYGNDIVHNSTYGLLTVNAPKSEYLVNGCVTTVVNRVKEDIDIALFPNPATDNLTIEAPFKATVCISNIQGQLIESFTTNDRRTNIDVNSFPGGVYVVEVKTEDGVGVEKFVKQ
jgi:mannan endo-1,4-beta-mannosidase